MDLLEVNARLSEIIKMQAEIIKKQTEQIEQESIISEIKNKCEQEKTTLQKHLLGDEQ